MGVFSFLYGFPDINPLMKRMDQGGILVSDIQYFIKQECHSGRELFTCTMCTSHISFFDPFGGPTFAPGALFEQTW